MTSKIFTNLKQHTIPFVWGVVLGVFVYVMQMMAGREISPLWVLASGLVFAAGFAMRRNLLAKSKTTLPDSKP